MRILARVALVVALFVAAAYRVRRHLTILARR